MALIKLSKVNLNYPLNFCAQQNLKSSAFRYITGKRIKNFDYYPALKDISMECRDGESIGLIGLNGAGKTTLLRTIAGIFKPSSGKVTRKGSTATLLDFSSGFEPHISGIENIRTRLLLLGVPKEQIQEKTNEIIDFCDLGDFIYLPSSTYSTGMNLRLAFATSTAISPQILIADEVLATGDKEFMKKVKFRLDKLMSNSLISIIASHSYDLLSNYCNRIIWIEDGRIKEDGPTKYVLNNYQKHY